MPYTTKCRDCRAPLPRQDLGAPRQRCVPCRSARLVEMGRENSLLWRQRNPDKAREYARRRYHKVREDNGYRSRAQHVAEKRKRAEALVPKLQKALRERGASFATVAHKFGLTRNAVAGLMHRARKAQQGARS